MIVYGGPNRSKPLDLGYAFGFPFEFANGTRPLIMQATEVSLGLLLANCAVFVFCIVTVNCIILGVMLPTAESRK